MFNKYLWNQWINLLPAAFRHFHLGSLGLGRYKTKYSIFPSKPAFSILWIQSTPNLGVVSTLHCFPLSVALQVLSPSYFLPVQFSLSTPGLRNAAPVLPVVLQSSIYFSVSLTQQLVLWRQRTEIFTFAPMCTKGDEGGNFPTLNHTLFLFGENPPWNERWLEAGPWLPLQPDIPSLEVITTWPGQSEASTWREECKEAGSPRAYSWSRHRCRSPSRVVPAVGPNQQTAPGVRPWLFS